MRSSGARWDGLLPLITVDLAKLSRAKATIRRSGDARHAVDDFTWPGEPVNAELSAENFRQYPQTPTPQDR